MVERTERAISAEGEASEVASLRQRFGPRLGGLARGWRLHAPLQVRELRRAMAAGDVEAVAAAAHVLAGSAGVLGADELAELSRRAEDRARTGELSAAAELLARIDAAFERFTSLLEGAAG